jgi:hypothetical protein
MLEMGFLFPSSSMAMLLASVLRTAHAVHLSMVMLPNMFRWRAGGEISGRGETTPVRIRTAG